MSIFSEFFGHPVNNQTLARLIVSHLPSSSWHTWHSCVLWKHGHFTFSPTWLKINSITCHSNFNFGSEWRKMLGLERKSFIYYLAPLLMNYSSNINCLMVSSSCPLIGSWALFNLLIGQNCLSFLNLFICSCSACIKHQMHWHVFADPEDVTNKRGKMERYCAST